MFSCDYASVSSGFFFFYLSNLSLKIQGNYIKDCILITNLQGPINELQQSTLRLY